MSDDTLTSKLYDVENKLVFARKAAERKRPDVAEKYIRECHDELIEALEIRGRQLYVFSHSTHQEFPKTPRAKDRYQKKAGDDMNMNEPDPLVDFEAGHPRPKVKPSPELNKDWEWEPDGAA